MGVERNVFGELTGSLESKAGLFDPFAPENQASNCEDRTEDEVYEPNTQSDR